MPGAGSSPVPLAARYARSASASSPRSRWSSPCWYRASPSAGWAGSDSRCLARSDLRRPPPSTRRAPASTCDRCTRHWPRYGTRSGWPAHQRLERLGPLGRPPQVEHVHARLDDGAVDDPRRDRRHLARRDGDHDLVEQAHAALAVSPSASDAWPRPSMPSASRSSSSNRSGDGDDLVGELARRVVGVAADRASRGTRACRGSHARRSRPPPRRGAGRRERTIRSPGPCRRGA